MNTKLFKINGLKDNQIKQAADILANGGIVAIPTETVYGLAADATNEEAVGKIFIAKNRPQDNPLIVHLASMEDIEKYVLDFRERERKLFEAFSPGPITVIMKSNGIIPKAVTAGLDTVAIRIPANEIAREIIRISNKPIAAPSANISGSPSPTCAMHVMSDLNGRIDAVVDGGECEVGIESTVISMTDKPVILRPGDISLKQIQSILPDAIMHNSHTNITSTPQSPGMKYKHYSPKANVIALTGSVDKFVEFVNSNNEEDTVFIGYKEDSEKTGREIIVYGNENDIKSLQKNLFKALRKTDELKAKKAYIHCPVEEDATGVFNRIEKSAGFKIINLEDI